MKHAFPSKTRTRLKFHPPFHAAATAFFLASLAPIFATATPPSVVASQVENPVPPLETKSAAPPSSPAEMQSFMLLDWETDFNDARNRASAENKDVFLLFTSSDSSFWGQRFDAEVLSRPAFGAALADLYIFVLIDQPKTYKLPDAEHRKNETLRAAWNVSTFPTVFLADKIGRPYAVTGYRSIPAAEYAAHIKSLRNIRAQRDQRLAAAAAASTDAERAVHLAAALREMEQDLLPTHYAPEIRELRRLDPKDSTGLLGDIDFSPQFFHLRARVSQLVRSQKDYKGALAAVDQFIQRNIPEGERLQKILFLKLPAHANAERSDHAAIIALMDAILAINSETETAKMATDVRARARALLVAATQKTTAQGLPAQTSQTASPTTQTPPKTPPPPPPSKTAPQETAAAAKPQKSQ